MRREFPETFQIVEDLKRKDHRNLSNSLRHYTAKSVENALLQLQSIDIPTVPQSDALLCQRRNRELVCRIFGAAVFEVSHGVNCKIDGIRYEHPDRGAPSKAGGRWWAD